MRQFFLSYAPGDDDLYVNRFFRDLSAAVRQALNAEHDRDVGFLDAANMGTVWPNEVRHELATCQTLVMLYSPRLFFSERCGRIWTVFSDRLRQYEHATGQRAASLIPVTWSSDLAAGPGSAPAEDLAVLIRLHSQRAAYLDSVAALARRVVEASRAYQLPPALPATDFENAENAFATQPRWQQRTRAHQQVHFVVAAGTREQMRIVRRDLEFYGERQEDWAPYRPAAAQPLASRARTVAAEQLFGSEVVPLDEAKDRIAEARERNDIVVVLVDAWAIQLEMFRDALAAFDIAEGSAVAVLVPANRDDPETKDHRRQLTVGVQSALPQSARRRDPLFRTDIETAGGFDDDLAAALEEAQNRIFGKGRLFRRPAGGPANSRPILEGP